MLESKFELGLICTTAGVVEDLNKEEILDLIIRHSQLEQGELCGEDQQTNENAILPGHEGRILSCYVLHDTRYYVITEWDRSATIVLRASEY